MTLSSLLQISVVLELRCKICNTHMCLLLFLFVHIYSFSFSPLLARLLPKTHHEKSRINNGFSEDLMEQIQLQLSTRYIFLL